MQPLGAKNNNDCFVDIGCFRTHHFPPPALPGSGCWVGDSRPPSQPASCELPVCAVRERSELLAEQRVERLFCAGRVVALNVNDS